MNEIALRVVKGHMEIIVPLLAASLAIPIFAFAQTRNQRVVPTTRKPTTTVRQQAPRQLEENISVNGNWCSMSTPRRARLKVSTGSLRARYPFSECPRMAGTQFPSPTNRARSTVRSKSKTSRAAEPPRTFTLRAEDEFVDQIR